MRDGEKVEPHRLDPGRKVTKVSDAEKRTMPEPKRPDPGKTVIKGPKQPPKK